MREGSYLELMKDYTDLSGVGLSETIVIDYDGSTVLLECTKTGKNNDDFIALLKRRYVNRIEIARGGSVAVEAVRMSER